MKWPATICQSKVAVLKFLLDYGCDPRVSASCYCDSRPKTLEGANGLHIAATKQSPAHAAVMIKLILASILRRWGAEEVQEALGAEDRSSSIPLYCAVTSAASEAILSASSFRSKEESSVHVQEALKRAKSKLSFVKRYEHLNAGGFPERCLSKLVLGLSKKVKPKTVATPPSNPITANIIPKTYPNCAGTHLGRLDCSCRPKPNQVCLGYSGAVSTTCPRCGHKIKGKKRRQVDGCRMNGDAYGWNLLLCEACGLEQKDGWDEA